MPGDVVQETLQRDDPAGASREPAVQADRHHGRTACQSFGMKRVETVPQIGEELLALGETIRDGEPHVVDVERIGDDELRRDRVAMPVMVEPVRKVVVVSIRNIGETAPLRRRASRS